MRMKILLATAYILFLLGISLALVPVSLPNTIRASTQNTEILIPQVGPPGIYKALGDSMLPLIMPESLILAKTDFPFENVKEGDIIIFEFEGKFIAHQVILVSNWQGQRRMIAKGINNKSVDLVPITKDIYRGLVVGTIWR